MKKLFCFALVMALLLSSVAALATNHAFEPFSVSSKTPILVTSADKSDNEQRWYVNIKKANRTDILLYFNVRKSEGGKRLSNALTFSAAGSKSTKYTTKTQKGQTIYLHAQLNSSQWTPDDFWYIARGEWCP